MLIICSRAHDMLSFRDTGLVARSPSSGQRSPGEPPPYQFKPHERPFMPGSPATPDHPLPRRIGDAERGLLAADVALIQAMTDELGARRPQPGDGRRLDSPAGLQGAAAL
jgi:hypothetical protein